MKLLSRLLDKTSWKLWMVEKYLLNVSRCCSERKYYKENFQSMLHTNPNNYGQDIRVSPDPNILNKKWFHHNFLNFDLIPIFPAKIAPDPHGLQIWPLCQIGTKQNVPWTWEHGKVEILLFICAALFLLLVGTPFPGDVLPSLLGDWVTRDKPDHLLSPSPSQV